MSFFVGANMKFLTSINVKCEVNEQTEYGIYDSLEKEFTRISENCFIQRNCIRCDLIHASFGSILRTDSTRVYLEKNKKLDGYNIIAETEYKPSVWFWVFFIIDILLIETVIGFAVGIGITLGLYFYNKNLVIDAINNVLKNIKNEIE